MASNPFPFPDVVDITLQTLAGGQRTNFPEHFILKPTNIGTRHLLCSRNDQNYVLQTPSISNGAICIYFGMDRYSFYPLNSITYRIENRFEKQKRMKLNASGQMRNDKNREKI
jgi:hypothetical protein